MIVGLKKAILHILDTSSGVGVFSDELLDVTDAQINTFITTHIEKLYESASLRKAEFKPTSGFMAKIQQYENGDISFADLSKNAAERLYDAIASSEDPKSCDLIAVEFVSNESKIFGLLKCDNKTGFTHSVLQSEGRVKNNIINHYAILPSLTNRLGECAFINLKTQEIAYRGKNSKIDGDTVDIIAELLLECEYEISPRESANTVTRIAKKVAVENGADQIETRARIKEYITESIEEENYEYVDTKKVAEKVFQGMPSVRDEFVEKLEKAGVPEKVEANKYITKKMTSNIKISTNTGVELSFPPEHYKNPEFMELITNEDGTLSIKINNITELTNR